MREALKRGWAVRTMAMLVLAFGVTSCVLFGDGDGEEPPARLRVGALVKYPAPLPSLTPIYVDKTNAEGVVSSRLAFRAWDFNADGLFDMVEVLDGQGKLSFRLYDLDFDGIVDFKRQLRPKSESGSRGTQRMSRTPGHGPGA